MNFIIAAVFDNYISAHLTLGRLQDEQINCWLQDEHTTTVYPGSTFATGGIKLMVAEPQIEKALAIINYDKESYKEQYPCPKCGSVNIEVISIPSKEGSWLSTIAHIVLNGETAMPIKKTYHCFDCEHEYEVAG